MTLKQYFDRAKEYEKSNPTYAGLLFHIAMFCQEDFLPLFTEAEKEGKQLYLIEVSTSEFEDEPVVELANLGIK